jgi:hypothetical protein
LSGRGNPIFPESEYYISEGRNLHYLEAECLTHIYSAILILNHKAHSSKCYIVGIGEDVFRAAFSTTRRLQDQVPYKF